MAFSKRFAITTLGALIIGAGTGAWLFSSKHSVSSTDVVSTPTAPVVNSTSSELSTVLQEIGNLKKALGEEMLARRHLEEMFARISKTIDNTPRKTYTNVSEHDVQNAANKDVTHKDNQISFEGALVAVGVDATHIALLQQRIEHMELQQIYLRNQAQREGWIGTPRFSEERRKFDDRDEMIRKELGDDAYDRYLYLSGDDNRVAVLSVLTGSAAQAAGLSTGDIIYRYDQRRIFQWSDLNSATTEGRAGESISLELHRVGQTMTIYVARGPLGVRLTTQIEKPQ